MTIIDVEGRLVDAVDWLDSHGMRWIGHIVQGVVYAVRFVRIGRFA